MTATLSRTSSPNFAGRLLRHDEINGDRPHESFEKWGLMGPSPNDPLICAVGDCMKNGIIFDAVMAEKKIENGDVRYSAAYPTGRERISSMGLDYREA